MRPQRTWSARASSSGRFVSPRPHRRDGHEESYREEILQCVAEHTGAVPHFELMDRLVPNFPALAARRSANARAPE